MFTLSTYLDKYRRLAPPEASVRKAFVAIVRDECAIDIREQEITLRNGGVMITCHPVVRSEVIRMAPRILNMLREVHGVRLSFIR